MMKVAFYIESMILGGAEKMLVDIVNHMDTNLFDISIISIFKESVYPSATTYDFRKLVNEKVHIKSLVDNSNHALYNLFSHAYSHISKRWIYNLLVKDEYDIEVAFYEGLPTEFVSYSSNIRSQKITWLHTDSKHLYHDKSHEFIKKTQEIYSRYDCVIGVSQHVAQSFQQNINHSNCITIYNGIDLDDIRKKASEKCNIPRTENTTFLTVGRLVPVKGYDRIIKVAGKLYTEGYHFRLLMIGDGIEREKLSKMIDELHLNETVKLLGTQNNPGQYYSVCNAILCASHYEGFGLSLLEAMACGLPALTVNFEGAEEILGDSNRDLIYSNDDDGIYRMMKNALDNPEALNAHRQSCIHQAELFDISVQVKQIQNVFMGEIG